MGQALMVCPACTICCATHCCGCCITVPGGLQRELVKHREVFRAIGLRHEHLVVLWLKFQVFDQDASGKLHLDEFLEGIGLTDNTFAKRAFDVLDDEQTDSLTFHEFCRALVVYCTFDKAALSLFAFDVFDFDGDGVLSGPDVQRAVLEVYGRDAAGNTGRLLDKAKTLAHRHSSGKAARVAEGQHFALDRRTFDMFVREVPSLCFPVFTVQRRLWETCGGQQFWRRITRERQERAKHALRALPGQGSSYEYKDWRELVAVMGTPTMRQKQSLKKLGLMTPVAAGGAAGSGKGRRHSAFEFSAGAGGAPGAAGATRGRRGSTGAMDEAAATGSVLRRQIDSKRGVASASAAGGSVVTTTSSARRRAMAWGSDSGSERGRRSSAGAPSMVDTTEPLEGGPSAEAAAGAASGGNDGGADLTEVPTAIRGLTKHQIATVSVFGSAAERRAAAAAMGGLSKDARKQQARKRRSLAADNLETIRALTGEDAYEAEHYKKMNKVGRMASAKAAKNRRRSLEATALRAAQGARRARVSGASSGNGGRRGPGAAARPSAASAGPGTVVVSARPRARRSSLAVSTNAPGTQRASPGFGASPAGSFVSPSGPVVSVRSGGGGRGHAPSTASPGRARRASTSAAPVRSRRSSISKSPSGWAGPSPAGKSGAATSRRSFGGSPHGQAKRRVGASPTVDLGF